MGIQIWRNRRSFHYTSILGLQKPVEALSELCITVVDQIASLLPFLGQVHTEISGLLSHPLAVAVRGNSRYMDPPAAVHWNCCCEFSVFGLRKSYWQNHENQSRFVQMEFRKKIALVQTAMKRA